MASVREDGGEGGGGWHILDGAKRGEKNKSLKLNRAETNAGSMELRERGNQAQAVDIVFMATSLSAVRRESLVWVEPRPDVICDGGGGG